ncbi:rod shape-determining protein MreC [Cohnella thailandensis]|uniref:Cell shape-determining protein MreC n=1 Tax=Cohnella thailandensis TaxID=557557 RepID=A0A841SSG5_9BACL|nr:rod shape-determining protein MreC [Cohnella thailandensis]MBB6633919.1 rod shape-determining protein MreC [Cohnella thailandensis]
MRNKRLFILMIGLILFVSLLGFSYGRTGLTWPERFVNDAVGTVQEALYRPVGAVSDFFRDLGRLSDVYEENEQLRQTVARYTQDKIRYNMIENENKRLQDELHFTERQKQLYDYRYLIAQVIASSSNPYDKTIKINLGSNDGIKPKMAVTTVDGLVGLVSTVSEFTSTVTPISELDSASADAISIAATVLGREDQSFGIVDYDKENKVLQMSKIDENDQVVEGDLIVTSGLGNVLPKGLIIGTVISNQVGDFGLTHTATIEPAAKFDHLNEVFVVVTSDVDAP